ncbi:MAG: crossover junction endodeoxyribonuclease RuvC, partial [Rhodospirillaceae bacterium]
MRLIGLDPGLRTTGWGVIAVRDNRLSHVANGTVRTDGSLSLAERLVQLRDGLTAVLREFAPAAAAVEESFV